MLKLLVVDDEPLAHQVIRHFCQAHTDVEIIEHCYSAAEAMAVLARQQVDVLLLDIQMPVLTGLDMLKLLHIKPAVIVCSAFPDYALQGFELDVTDYLLKPVDADRFAMALQKVRRRMSQHQDLPPSISLKVERGVRKFVFADICCFEAYGNYVKVWCGQQMVLVNSTLKQIQQQAAQAGFVQIHKSFVVNKQHVSAMDCHKVVLSNQMQIKIGPSYKEQLKALV